MRTTITMAVVCATAAGASAAPLTGSGTNLPIPSPNPGSPPRELPAINFFVTGGFEGTWSSPAQPDWIGTFTAVGPQPVGLDNPAGTTDYDFTALPIGALPAQSIFGFGDVDGGSNTSEIFEVLAFDAGGSLLTTPWLDEPFAVAGSGTGSGGAILPNNMPSWDWNSTTGTYTIDGSGVSGGNPTVSVFLESNTPIATMTLTRQSQFANFRVSAPIPAPSAATLFAFAGVAATRRRRR